MHPILFNLGSIPIHTYGFMIAVGFLVGVSTVRRLATRAGLPVEKTVDLAFWCLVVGFLGSRTLYVITQIDTFVQDPMAFFRIWEGGLVFLGGPLAVFPFLVWYLRKHKMPFWNIADCLVPGVAVAQAFGRIGCLAAGCCYGKPTGTDFGIRFYSGLVEDGLKGIPLHPTQIYESTAMFLLFGGLLWIFRRRKFAGQVMLSYFIMYPIVRSIIEEFRGDTIRGFVIEGMLSTSQFISGLIFVAALSGLIYRLKQVNEGKVAPLATSPIKGR